MSFEKADKEFQIRFKSDRVYALNSIYDLAGHDVGAVDPSHRGLEVETEWLNPRLSALIGLAEMRETTFALMEEMRDQFDSTITVIDSQVCPQSGDRDASEERLHLTSCVDAKVDALTMEQRASKLQAVIRQIMRHPTFFGLPVVVGPAGLPTGDEVMSQLKMRVPKQGAIQLDWFNLLEWLDRSFGAGVGQFRMRQWAATWLAKRWALMQSPFEIKNGKLMVSSDSTYGAEGMHSLAYTFIAMKVFAEFVNSPDKVCPAELRSILAKGSLYKGEPGVVFKAGGGLLVRYMKQDLRWTFTADLAECLREFVATFNVPDLKTRVQVFN